MIPVQLSTSLINRFNCLVALARIFSAVFVEANGLATSFHRDADELVNVSLSLNRSVEDLFGKDMTHIVK